MDNLYQWLYDYYALPQLKGLETGQDNVLETLAARLDLPKLKRRRLLDTAENLRLQWGTESFALGIRFGLELAAPHKPDEDCSRLMDFLP